MSADISFRRQNCHFAGASGFADFWQLATATAFWLPNWLPVLLGNWQRQQAPLKGCACGCRLQLPIPATPRPADSASASPRRSEFRLWMAAVSRNGGIHPFAAKRLPRRGPPRANADGSRAYVRPATAIGRRSPPIAPDWPSPPLHGTCAQRYGAIRPVGHSCAVVDGLLHPLDGPNRAQIL